MAHRKRSARSEQKPHPDRVALIEAKSERDSLLAAIGVDGNPMMRELVKAYGVLVHASDPTTGRDVGTPRSPSYEPAIPGAATKAYRSARKRVDRGVERLLDQVLAAVDEPHYRPPRGGKCPDCGWRGKPGSKHCDRDGSTLEVTP